MAPESKGITCQSLARSHREVDVTGMKNLHHLLAGPRFQNVMLGLGVGTMALVAVWTLSPSSTLAANNADRPADFVDLGTLTDQTLSIRVHPGAFGPSYDVLDETGMLVGHFKSEFELIAAFSVPAPSQQLADVPTIDDLD